MQILNIFLNRARAEQIRRLHRHMSPEHKCAHAHCSVYMSAHLSIAQVCEEVQFVWVLAALWEAATKRSEFKNFIPNP